MDKIIGQPSSIRYLWLVGRRRRGLDPPILGVMALDTIPEKCSGMESAESLELDNICGAQLVRVHGGMGSAQWRSPEIASHTPIWDRPGSRNHY